MRCKLLRPRRFSKIACGAPQRPLPTPLRHFDGSKRIAGPRVQAVEQQTGERNGEKRGSRLRRQAVGRRRDLVEFEARPPPQIRQRCAQLRRCPTGMDVGDIGPVAREHISRQIKLAAGDVDGKSLQQPRNAGAYSRRSSEPARDRVGAAENDGGEFDQNSMRSCAHSRRARRDWASDHRRDRSCAPRSMRAADRPAIDRRRSCRSGRRRQGSP